MLVSKSKPQNGNLEYSLNFMNIIFLFNSVLHLTIFLEKKKKKIIWSTKMYIFTENYFASDLKQVILASNGLCKV